MKMYCVLALGLAVGAVQAHAYSPAGADASADKTTASVRSKAKVKYDPGRMVCEIEEETGSRLGQRKVCRTSAEWAESRRLDREMLETKQRSVTPPVN